MAESSKKPQAGKPATSTSQGSRPNQPPSRPSRRTLSKKRREEQRQRMVIIATGTAIGLAVLALVIGLIYDQLWVPSRPVAQVNNVTLTTGDYWLEQRYEYARQISQNLQLLALFGGNAQLSGQFAGRAPAINQQVATIRSAPIDEQVVTQWQNNQLIRQGAANLGIQVSDDEVIQSLTYDLGSVFLPPPPVTPTATLTPTVVLTATTATTATVAATATSAATPTATPEPTATPTVTPGGPTLTPTVTETPVPTSTPLPTPAASVAQEQLPRIIDELYERYTNELEQVEVSPELSKDDFRLALIDQYRRQVLERKIQEQLVPEAGFTPTADPSQVTARQILLRVEPASDATEEQREQAYAEVKREADDLLARLRDGEDFAQLATEFSEDPGSAEQGGNIGSFDKSGVADNGATYPPALVEAAFKLGLNEISEPVRTQFGWHILQVTNRQVPDQAQQLNDRRAEAFNEWLEEQRTSTTVRRFPEPTPTPVLPTTEPVPTTEPTYLPGPPTPLPTATPTPEITPSPAITTTSDALTPEPTGTASAVTPTTSP